MPFINGRFYMNPAYGRALEAARAKDSANHLDPHPFARRSDLIDHHGEWTPAPTLLSSEQDRNLGRQDLAQNSGRWVSIDGHHVLIQENHEGRVPYDKPRNKREAALANIVYNETSSLRVDPRAKPGDGGSVEALHDACEGIAEVAKRAHDSGHPEYVAPPTLSEKDKEAMHAGNLDAIHAYNDSLAAAREASAGADQTSGATQFRLRPPSIDKDRPINRKDTTFAYGPFLNTLGRRQTVVFAP
jgi:hypothetical protein